MNGWQDVAMQFNVMYSNCIANTNTSIPTMIEAVFTMTKASIMNAFQDMVAFIEGGGPSEILEILNAILGTALVEIGEYDKAILTYRSHSERP